MTKQTVWSIRRVGDRFYIIDCNGALIAEVNHQEQANLIAAAPKMLTTLQAIDCYVQARPPFDILQRKHDSEQISDQISEAIAQATGSN